MRALIDLLVPSRCAGCGRDGPAMCPACAALLGRPVPVMLDSVPAPVFALGRYRGPLRTALLAYKERGRRELAGPLGGALATGVRHLLGGGRCGAAGDGGAGDDGAADGGAGDDGAADGRTAGDGCAVWLVPVPSRSTAARRRGGDHVRRMADSAVSALTAAGVAAAVAPALRLALGARDSVGLDAAARAANLAGRIRTRAAWLPPAAGVVLVDDVATTGATATACTVALAGAGVPVGAVLVVASAAPLRRSGGLRDRPVTVHAAGSTVEPGNVTAW